MAKTNKHKTVGTPKKAPKESWWTKERIRTAIIVCAAVIVLAIAFGVYHYISSRQDSVVGTWEYSFESQDTGDAMVVTFHFNDNNTFDFQRTRNGEEEASMEGEYNADSQKGYLTVAYKEDGVLDNATIYSYQCKKGKLDMKDISNPQAELHFVKAQGN